MSSKIDETLYKAIKIMLSKKGKRIIQKWVREYLKERK